MTRLDRKARKKEDTRISPHHIPFLRCPFPLVLWSKREFPLSFCPQCVLCNSRIQGSVHCSKGEKRKHELITSHIPNLSSNASTDYYSLLCSAAQSCLPLCDPMDCSSQASLSFIISWSLLKLMSIKSVMPSNHLILCRPLLLLPSIFPSIKVFSNESALSSGGQSIEASASVLPMNTQDWFPLGLTHLISLQSKGLSRVFSNTHNSKASILRCSAFFIVQLSHLYMTTGKTIALTRWTFFGKVMSTF